ncbi:peptidoglycan editing factor PgeF [Paenactinomyces guangxiensis]|uniref:Purine nucleoside phosphorylase n=1 Tax=Paenactinomyces guangxiensis TaxID=1490290 RepID=A0A7W1WQL1_9BACL|nr:peptidoglycan editing factor PgeF [Paenactinomyces guangxiensis]MBA4494235.1 peptidoglycan editing factor PgeF [Paenactinomyces guangxiensis]MBH8590731.1 peptidoglycan editing factor PgeF [Paenactinomyces guangxiensis]
MEPFKYHDMLNIPYFSLDLWEKEFPHLVVGFSARRNGEDIHCRNYALHVGDRPEQVIENRKLLAKQLGIPFTAWTCGEQVHGTHVEQVTAADRGKGCDSRESAFSGTDGMITGEPDILLASYYADCVPLYFYSPDIDFVGVAHAGWKGTVQGIGIQMVQKLLQLGAKREEIRVAIGPSIGSCCYEVDERVIEPLQQVISEADTLQTIAVSHIPGKWQLDLRQANAELLKREGVSPGHIQLTKWCTSCDKDYFYSHRRDRGKTGRMVAWIGKRERGS